MKEASLLVLITTDSSIQDAMYVGLDTHRFTAHELVRVRPDVAGWWIGPAAFPVSAEQWQKRAIVVMQPADDSLTQGMKKFLERRWRNFIVAAGKLAGANPLVEGGNAFFNLP